MCDYLFLLSYIGWLLSVCYEELSTDRNRLKEVKKSAKDCKDLSYQFDVEATKVFKVYVFLVLLKERQVNQVPAWEGIRIVREEVNR